MYEDSARLNEFLAFSYLTTNHQPVGKSHAYPNHEPSDDSLALGGQALYISEVRWQHRRAHRPAVFHREEQFPCCARKDPRTVRQIRSSPDRERLNAGWSPWCANIRRLHAADASAGLLCRYRSARLLVRLYILQTSGTPPEVCSFRWCDAHERTLPTPKQMGIMRRASLTEA